MNYVGIDLHKKSIVLCVQNQDLRILARKTFACGETESIREFFQQQQPFQAVVEATASYHWLVELLEPLAQRVVLAHPAKMRVIAESCKKTDRLDAQVLAEFLARNQIPQATRPTPRQREHRSLVRHRQYLKGRLTAVRTKIRRILSDYNADRRDLFTRAGQTYLASVQLNPSDRFVLDQLWADSAHLSEQLIALTQQLKAFAAAAPAAEAEARAVLQSIPGVGPVTVEVVVSELGDVGRFSSAKKACAYAGLVPTVRESAGKGQQLGITKTGSGLLRWALVEASWRVIRQTRHWGTIYERIKRRRGAKRAIVAVARRLLSVMVALLKSGQPYRFAAA